MQKLINAINHFTDWTGRSVSWLTLAMVLVTSCVVFLRYAFDTGWIALQESVSYMHALVFLIGAAYTLKYDEHVRVDIVYSRLGTRGKAWINLLGSLFILLPVMAFIIWVSWEYVFESWAVLESSGETGGLPGIFLLKSCILLMSALLILQAIAQLLQSLLTIMDKESA
ncbi:MAG: TRAP transporter small permease subunit [Gammaproteobacteria bacterium]|nr:TRAP transporter small permease subunit [Gammaproteobacteria bacterium]